MNEFAQYVVQGVTRCVQMGRKSQRSRYCVQFGPKTAVPKRTTLITYLRVEISVR